MSINVNKFPVNTISDELVNGIGNLNVSVTTSKSGVIQTILSTPCTSATSSFKIQISFTTYSAWANGGILIGHTGSTTEYDDMRVFFTSTDLYYDFNSSRKYTSASSYFGKVNNWEIGNYYIKNLDNNTNILTGTTQSIGTHLNYLGMWGASDSCILHWLKIWQNGSTLTYDIIPFKDSLGYGLYDQVSHTMKYRVTNNNQVQLIGSSYQTQVTSLYWLDTMINKAYMGSNLIFEKIVSYYDTEYFTIQSLEDNNTISFNKNGSADTKTIYWSSDKTTWNSVSSDSGTIKTLSNNEKIYIKGSNNNYASSTSVYNYFSSNAAFNISGNIMSLIYGDNFIGQTTLPSDSYIFGSIFRNPKVVDASNLILPATTLTDSCYREMFKGCSSLTSAPVLPATTLASNCYRAMFSGCALTDAPTLPATTMAENCYYYMFENCASLTAPPVLSATTLAVSCYMDMFRGCTSLTSAPVLSATTLTDSCYRGMFYGCTALTTAPELPATTLLTYCYQQMFYGCTALTTAPELPATTLVSRCYYQMFYGCTSLASPPVLPATTLSGGCYNGMFYGCTSLTTAPALPATTLVSNCYYQMFYGCTALTTAPELPATTLVSNCYYQMFMSCMNLNYIKAMFTTKPGIYTRDWVNGVSATGTFVKNTAATWDRTDTSGIPSGWTVQTASS